MPTDVAEFLEDDTESVVVLEMTASNDSGETIDFYPDQGQIQVGREQLDADLWFSEPIAASIGATGSTTPGGFWQLTQPFDEAVAEESLTLIVSDAMSSDDFETVASDFELTVRWDAP